MIFLSPFTVLFCLKKDLPGDPIVQQEGDIKQLCNPGELIFHRNKVYMPLYWLMSWNRSCLQVYSFNTVTDLEWIGLQGPARRLQCHQLSDFCFHFGTCLWFHEPPLGLKLVLLWTLWSRQTRLGRQAGGGRCEGLDGIMLMAVVIAVGVDSLSMTSSSLQPLGESELMSVVKKEAFTVF